MLLLALEDEVKLELEELDNVVVEAVLEDVVDLEELFANTAGNFEIEDLREKKITKKVGKEILENMIGNTYPDVDEVVGRLVDDILELGDVGDSVREEGDGDSGIVDSGKVGEDDDEDSGVVDSGKVGEEDDDSGIVDNGKVGELDSEEDEDGSVEVGEEDVEDSGIVDSGKVGEDDDEDSGMVDGGKVGEEDDEDPGIVDGGKVGEEDGDSGMVDNGKVGELDGEEDEDGSVEEGEDQ